MCNKGFLTVYNCLVHMGSKQTAQVPVITDFIGHNEKLNLNSVANI
jgi:hypothetical protein